MSYSDFQGGLVLAITKPLIAMALRNGDSSGLRHLDLSPREVARLIGLAGQPGMALYCSLSRANRLEVIAEGYPMTLVVLEPILREVLDDLWDSNPPSGYRFSAEVDCFADAVKLLLEDSERPVQYLREVFLYERACWGLAQTLRDDNSLNPPTSTIVEFEHSPDQLLEPLSQLMAPPLDLPQGRFTARVTLTNGQFNVETIQAQVFKINAVNSLTCPRPAAQGSIQVPSVEFRSIADNRDTDLQVTEIPDPPSPYPFPSKSPPP